MLMICSFPPPTTGQSHINAALRDGFRRAMQSCYVQNIGPGDVSGIRYHLNRWRRVTMALLRLIVTKEDKLFLSSEAGFGSLYLLLIFAVARGRRRVTFLHHHVYSYIANPSWLHELLMRLVGPKCTHILLSPRMATAFQVRFGSHRRYMTLHNSIFVDEALRAGRPDRQLDVTHLTIGFIGRLERAKGFDDFLSLLDRLHGDARFHFVVAGDHEQTEFREELHWKRAELGSRLDLRGFIRDHEKARFFSDIDVLVFPSKYRNEASPMVCYEALAMGVPVLVTDVGAVSDIVDEGSGRVFELGPDMLNAMEERLRIYAAEPSTLGEAQRAAAARYRVLERLGEDEWMQLREMLDADRRGGTL